MVPLNLAPAISMFSSTITAYNTTGSYVDREWQEVQDPDFKIVGRISNFLETDYRILKEGGVTGAGIIIHQTGGRKLSVFDSDPVIGITSIQSYVRHQGEIYKVLKRADRQVQGGYVRWIAMLFKPRQNP